MKKKIYVGILFVFFIGIIFFSLNYKKINKQKNVNILNANQYTVSSSLLEKTIQNTWSSTGSKLFSSLTDNNFKSGEESGIFKYSDEEYIYRGDITNNNLIFDNMCFKIVKTTTDGIKVIYNGIPNNGICNAQDENTTIGKQYNEFTDYKTDVLPVLQNWAKQNIKSLTSQATFYNRTYSTTLTSYPTTETENSVNDATEKIVANVGLLDMVEAIQAGMPSAFYSSAGTAIKVNINENYYLINNSVTSKTMSSTGKFFVSTINSTIIEEPIESGNAGPYLYNIYPTIGYSSLEDEGGKYNYLRPVIVIPYNTYCATGSGTTTSPYRLGTCSEMDIYYHYLIEDENINDEIADSAVHTNLNTSDDYPIMPSIVTSISDFINIDYNYLQDINSTTYNQANNKFDGYFKGFYTEKDGKGTLIYDENGNYVAPYPIGYYATTKKLDLYALYEANYTTLSALVFRNWTVTEYQNTNYVISNTISTETSTSTTNPGSYDVKSNVKINYQSSSKFRAYADETAPKITITLKNLNGDRSTSYQLRTNATDATFNSITKPDSFADMVVVNYYVDNSLNKTDRYKGIFDGYYTEANGKGTKVFNSTGEVANSYTSLLKDITLYPNYKTSYTIASITPVEKYQMSWVDKDNVDYTGFSETYENSANQKIYNLYLSKIKITDGEYKYHPTTLKTTAQEFKTKIGENIVIYDKNDEILNDYSLIYTGCTYESDGKTYTIIVQGDTDGDGIISATDYVNAYNYFMKSKRVLSGIYLKAADMDDSNTIEMTDYVLLYYKFMNIKR